MEWRSLRGCTYGSQPSAEDIPSHRYGSGVGQGRGRGGTGAGGRRASSDVTQQSGVSWCGIPEAYVGCESLLRKLSSTKVVACLKVRMGSVAVCD
jgi:hypothetical protein